MNLADLWRILAETQQAEPVTFWVCIAAIAALVILLAAFAVDTVRR